MFAHSNTPPSANDRRVAFGTFSFPLILFIVTSLVAFTVTYHTSARELLQNKYEDVHFALVSSAQLAYAYGTRHFDATHAADYDLDRAEYFFEEAEKLDPTLPYLQHQRARIAFLKGDFALALSRINQELKKNPEASPSSYYVRGLIRGYAGDYEGSAKDYEAYLRTDSKNWAAINDYAWVLIKGERYRDALIALDWGLIYWPDNAWLLNSKATTLFEMGRAEQALLAARAAARAAMTLNEMQWLQAYPGNDPLIAPQGVLAFQNAVLENMHTILLALEK